MDGEAYCSAQLSGTDRRYQASKNVVKTGDMAFKDATVPSRRRHWPDCSTMVDLTELLFWLRKAPPAEL